MQQTHWKSRVMMLGIPALLWLGIIAYAVFAGFSFAALLTAGWFALFNAVGLLLYAKRDKLWVKRAANPIYTVLATGQLFLVGLLFEAPQFAGTVLSMGLAYFAFQMVIGLIRLLLRSALLSPFPLCGVARTMIDEVLQMGIARVFIALLLLILVIAPSALGSEDRVIYMVQRFLVYTVWPIGFLLGLMTVLVASYSISHEIASRQIHMTLTKPLSRGKYLAGKWLGIMLINTALVVVSCIAIYGSTMSIAHNPELSDLDRFEVYREVLTARIRAKAQPVEATWEQMYQNVLEEKQARDPERFGLPDTPFGSIPRESQQEVIADTISRFYTVDGGTSKQYKFTGLKTAVDNVGRAIALAQRLLQDRSGLSETEAREYVNYAVGRPSKLDAQTAEKVSQQAVDELTRILEREVIQLVLTPDISPAPMNMFVEITMRANDRPWPPIARPGDPPQRHKLVIETDNELVIPASLIDKDGNLVVTIDVPRERRDGYQQPFIGFDYKDKEVELFYRVGSFESNLIKAMVLIWLRLGFWAIVGLVAGAMLSFPVAALMGCVFFLSAEFSGVIDESLQSYVSVGKGAGAWEVATATVGVFFKHLGEGDVYRAVKLIMRLIGEGFMLLVPSFGEYVTSQELSKGQVITNALVLKGTFWIGVVWTGLIGVVGAYLFSKKEIARVTA